ncbi:hypothetical protein BKA61DRAFT_566614 [Leptodontidium sp. MPI-SDFR-AT-0119]|nr:hypothetical protein BKA61DRAFT_566614 [Leptodontidium sp. MPI-SDFR-AT-0119]
MKGCVQDGYLARTRTNYLLLSRCPQPFIEPDVIHVGYASGKLDARGSTTLDRFDENNYSHFVHPLEVFSKLVPEITPEGQRLLSAECFDHDPAYEESQLTAPGPIPLLNDQYPLKVSPVLAIIPNWHRLTATFGVAGMAHDPQTPANMNQYKDAHRNSDTDMLECSYSSDGDGDGEANCIQLQDRSNQHSEAALMTGPNLHLVKDIEPKSRRFGDKREN